MELTTKQTAVLQAMKRLRKPAGVQVIMTSSQGVEGKAQVKAVLDQLVKQGAVVHQSNGQYRATPNALKSVNTAPKITGLASTKKPPASALQDIPSLTKPPVKQPPAKPSVKPEVIDSRIKELTEQLNAAQKQVSELTDKNETLRSQLSDEQESNQALINNLNEVREITGTHGSTHAGLIDALKMLNKFHQNWHKPAEAESEHPPIQPRAAIAQLTEQLSGMYDDTASISIFKNKTPEIICDDNRYEIPTGSDEETQEFFQSLTWISGQCIKQAA